MKTYYIKKNDFWDSCEYCYNEGGYLYDIYENFSKDDESLIGNFYLCPTHKSKLEQYLIKEELKKDRLEKLKKLQEYD